MINSKYFNLNFSDLSTYRTQLMGIAASMIIIGHANAYQVLMPSILSSICSHFALGVDIFLFLSGLGLYYSLSRNNLKNKSDYFPFYKKRFIRIFVPYFIIYTPYCLIFILLSLYSIGDSILCLSTLEFWLFHRGAWFISLIIILYLFVPFLYKGFSTQYKWLTAVGIITILVILRNIYIVNPSSTNILYNIQFVLNRIPNFIIGLAFGSYCKEGKLIAPQYILLLFCLCMITSKFIGLWKCPWIFVPILLYIFILLIKLLENSWIDKCIKFLGQISLESYLTNITLKSILAALIPTYISSPIFYGKYLEYSVIIVAGLLLAYYVNKIAQKILSKAFTPPA